MPLLDLQDRRFLTACRTLGGKGLPLVLSDQELLRLCAIAAIDLNQASLVDEIATPEELEVGYYGLSLEWFQQPVSAEISLATVFLSLKASVPDFVTYFQCLCSIHKRRRKFALILEAQPFAAIEQIAPRALLEYGLRAPEILATWLIWRKWIYDVDNRSAQETGYLFEPILAAALGGIPQSAKKSPVRRSNDNSKGRQVDCLDSDNRLAYEFKMRVTIAASGQGRFQEELDFAQDCSSSGFTPVLLVLDPTPSTRLDELANEFRLAGGKAYVGNDAWQHIEQQAGEVMGKFVEEYVRKPLVSVDDAYLDLLPLALSVIDGELRVSIGDGGFVVGRRNLGISEDDSEEPDEESDDISIEIERALEGFE